MPHREYVRPAGPSVEPTWTRARSSSPKWIRHTMTFRSPHLVDQCTVWLPAGGKPLAERSERTRGRSAMARKALRVLRPRSVVFLVASQWRSSPATEDHTCPGDGTEAVPASGKHSLQGPSGAVDGTGDFDSESRAAALLRLTDPLSGRPPSGASAAPGRVLRTVVATCGPLRRPGPRVSAKRSAPAGPNAGGLQLVQRARPEDGQVTAGRAGTRPARLGRWTRRSSAPSVPRR